MAMFLMIPYELYQNSRRIGKRRSDAKPVRKEKPLSHHPQNNHNKAEQQNYLNEFM